MQLVSYSQPAMEIVELDHDIESDFPVTIAALKLLIC